MKPRGWLLAMALAAGCRERAFQEKQPGHLEARWSGADSGKISARATAEWCQPRRMLEIRAVQGDTGLALALYPAETLAAGKYRVVDPVKADSVPPAAGVAVRWFSQSSIQGLQGDSGTVLLERSGSGELSGTLTAKAHSVVDGKGLSVTGRFRSLTLRPQSRGCLSDTAAVSDTEGLDTE